MVGHPRTVQPATCQPVMWAGRRRAAAGGPSRAPARAAWQIRSGAGLSQPLMHRALQLCGRRCCSGEAARASGDCHARSASHPAAQHLARAGRCTAWAVPATACVRPHGLAPRRACPPQVVKSAEAYAEAARDEVALLHAIREVRAVHVACVPRVPAADAPPRRPDGFGSQLAPLLRLAACHARPHWASQSAGQVSCAPSCLLTRFSARSVPPVPPPARAGRPRRRQALRTAARRV